MNDGLKTAKGILIGVVLGSVFWALIIAFILWCIGKAAR
jgi:hypothetical protein